MIRGARLVERRAVDRDGDLNVGRMTTRVSCRWEKIEALLAEPNIKDLIEGYWQELAPAPIRDLPLDIDWPRLLRHEAEGIYRVWAARVDGTLAGFISFYVEPHLYYRTALFALECGHFLRPAFRDKGRLGWRMWKSGRDALKKEGVRFGMYHDNAKRPLMPFFLALGAEPLATLWVDRLDEEAT